MYIAEVKEKLPTNQYRADYFTIQYFFDVGNSLISIKCFTNYIYGNCWILTKKKCNTYMSIKKMLYQCKGNKSKNSLWSPPQLLPGKIYINKNRFSCVNY